MNIFKVFASGKKKFNEEHASAILSWFLNPKMEHGLGFQFVSRIIGELSADFPEIGKLKEKLNLKLRSEHSKDVKFDCFLEGSAGRIAVIDIILVIEDCVIAIENKIYSSSASDRTQLQREYDGLIKDKYTDKKIIMVFLVPIKDGLISPMVEKEFSELNIRQDRADHKAYITWQEHESRKTPSVVGIINGILKDEREAKIDPISEYTRHTLKALAAFIQNNFSGYEVEKELGKEIYSNKYKINDILGKKTGYVGVLYGIPGLLRLDPKKLTERSFVFTEEDMSNTKCYIEVGVFKNIVEWMMDGKSRDIKWDFSLPFESVLKIAESFGDKVVIGIKGGKKKLSGMSLEEIKSRYYVIESTETKENLTDDWMGGNVFVEIIKKQCNP